MECDFFLIPAQEFKVELKEKFLSINLHRVGKGRARLGDSLGTVFQARKEVTHKCVALNNLLILLNGGRRGI